MRCPEPAATKSGVANESYNLPSSFHPIPSLVGDLDLQGAMRMPLGTSGRVCGGDKLTNERTMNIKDSFRKLMSPLFTVS